MDGEKTTHKSKITVDGYANELKWNWCRYGEKSEVSNISKLALQ